VGIINKRPLEHHSTVMLGFDAAGIANDVVVELDVRAAAVGLDHTVVVIADKRGFEPDPPLMLSLDPAEVANAIMIELDLRAAAVGLDDTVAGIVDERAFDHHLAVTP